MTDTQYYYRFGNQDAQDGFLWSGVINTSSPVTKDQAKHLIRAKHPTHHKRLPAHTLIVSGSMLRAHGNMVSNA